MDSMRGGGGVPSLKFSCGSKRGGSRGLVKGGIMVKFSFHLGRLFSSNLFLFFFLGWGTGGVCKNESYEDMLFR